MLSKHLRTLLHKYLKGEETKEGKALFDKWYDSKLDLPEEVSINQEKIDEIDGTRRLAEIHMRISQEDKKTRHILTVRTFNPRRWNIAAAVLGILMIAGAFSYYGFFNNKIVIETSYGQTQTITLPDQSKIILNANSKVTFYRQWEEQLPRQVWLEGEAFFEVVHTSNHQKFIVHTEDNVEVEVLGTSFSVSGRKNNCRVVLNSGKVRLAHKGTDAIDTLTIKPGEMADLKKETGHFEKKVINPEIYNSWRYNKLIFDETPLYEVIQVLEETYGLQVQVTNKALLKKKISGSLPSQNLENLLFGLAESFNLNIQRNDNYLIIGERKSL